MEIQNNKECFVQLWLRLERTRCLLGVQYKRFCIRNVLKSWFCLGATDNFIYDVCRMCNQEGYAELPSPLHQPYEHRELLRAIVAVRMGISLRKVNLKALDAAYIVAFPRCKALNVWKKKRADPRLIDN